MTQDSWLMTLTVILMTNVTHIKCHMSKALLSDHTSGNHSQWNSWRAVERNVGQTACSLTRHLQTLCVWMCDLEHSWFYWICLRHKRRHIHINNIYLFDWICVWIWFASHMPCFDHQAGIPIVGVFAFTCKEMVQASNGTFHFSCHWVIAVEEKIPSHMKINTITWMMTDYDSWESLWFWHTKFVIPWSKKRVLALKINNGIQWSGLINHWFSLTKNMFKLVTSKDWGQGWLISIEK